MNLRRRLVTLATGVLLAAGLGVATAPQASAACEYFADLPARVSIDRPLVRVPVTLRGCEGVFEYASADVYGPDGFSDILIYDGARTDYWYLYDWERAGVYDTLDGGGFTIDNQTPTWRGDTSVVKIGTWAGVYAYRSGASGVVTAAAARYDTGSNKFIPYANRVVAIDKCSSATSCTVAAYVKTDGSGRATVRLSAPGTTYFRVRYGETAVFWGATSGFARI